MQSTGHAASIDQKISGVSRLLNAKFLRALWRRGCHFWRCVSAWRRSKNEPTTTEMLTVLEAANDTRRKGDKPALALRDLLHFGCAAYRRICCNKCGTLLRFEKWWHIADGAITRYRKAGLLWWRVAPT